MAWGFFVVVITKSTMFTNYDVAPWVHELHTSTKSSVIIDLCLNLKEMKENSENRPSYLTPFLNI